MIQAIDSKVPSAEESVIEPGDQVISKTHMDRGPGTASWVSKHDKKAFIVWGKFGIMTNRDYAILPLDDLMLV